MLIRRQNDSYNMCSIFVEGVYKCLYNENLLIRTTAVFPLFLLKLLRFLMGIPSFKQIIHEADCERKTIYRFRRIESDEIWNLG